MSRTGRRSADQPEFTIVDMRSGRGLGGHCYDYLLALKAAFADRRIKVIAPFVGPDAVANSRLNVYLRGLAAYRRAIAGRGIGIVHNSSLNDYLCLAAAAATIRPSRRGFCLMMLYRDPSVESFGAGGPALNRAAVWLIARMIRAGVILPASDSPLVLAHWLERTGTSDGWVVPTPPLPTAGDGTGAGLRVPEGADPLVVIPGRMRAEKGAANYPAVAEAVIETFPTGGLAIQTAEGDDAAASALAALRDRFGGEPRVVLLDEHLSGAEYGALLEAADIAVLPYDTSAYGAGSSGVVGDALDSGAVVVAAPIEWIKLEYGNDPRVFFVEDPGSVASLAAALERAAAGRAGGAARGDRTADFDARWKGAVDDAIALREGRAAA